MRDLSWPELLLIACVAGLLFMVVLVGKTRTTRNDEFRLVCKQSGGVTVHDGIKYQCLKVQK